jgi:Dihydroorotate dehydrogenase
MEQLPISGIGGIETWEDAVEFILLGSTTLQVTTAVMQYGYRIVEDMKNGLMHYMEEQGVDHLSDLVGIANKNILPAEDLDRDYKVYPKIDWDKCIGCGRCFISCFEGRTKPSPGTKRPGGHPSTTASVSAASYVTWSAQWAPSRPGRLK